MNQQQEQQQNTAPATLAHIEQVRMLILGMEQRLQVREEKLGKVVERAEGEGRRFEQLRTEMSVTDAWGRRWLLDSRLRWENDFDIGIVQFRAGWTSKDGWMYNAR